MSAQRRRRKWPVAVHVTGNDALRRPVHAGLVSNRDFRINLCTFKSMFVSTSRSMLRAAETNARRARDQRCGSSPKPYAQTGVAMVCR